MLKKFLVFSLLLVFVLSVAVGFGGLNPSQTVFGNGETVSVVQQYGQLQIMKGRLCDKNGNPVQLRGMSSFGLQWYPFETDTVKNLVNDWYISVVRAAMYTEAGGYIADSAIKEKVKSIVQAAIDNGIYVIIDWHILSDPDPNTYKKQAKEFFTEMAKSYGNTPNVIYEICNEPNKRSDGMMVNWFEIKNYAKFVIPAIRAVDKDNIIIVGTDSWSQGVDIAAMSPLTDKNIMYALHFYAATHKADLRARADSALAQGLAIFVTEWGTTNSSGDGPLDLAEAQKWLDWMAEKKISWVNWSFSQKNEQSAALVPGTDINGPWGDSDLSESGKWVKAKIIGN